VAAVFAVFGVLAVPFAHAAGDANRDSCENERLTGFRAYLPDCRAYEMVSPPYKQGYPVHIDASSEDGTRLVGWSWGVFAGAQGAPQPRANGGTEYEFSRGSGGWTVTPLAPPAAMDYGASSWYTASPDLSGTVWSMPTPPVGEDDYYVRRHDGSFVDVGPATPPADGPTAPPAPQGGGPGIQDFPFEGASGDLSHILFGVYPPFLWPGDSTSTSIGETNLYEYVGGGNSAPIMVAVSGGPGSTSLIGQCGVRAGGPFNEYNALSTDGSTVFFTPIAADEQECGSAQPPVDELFARIHESQTVMLSAPSPDGCTTPTCQAAPASDALFQGASQDGSKAFFDSTQQLLNNASEDSTAGDSAVRNSGSGCPEAEGSGCNLYEYDSHNPAGNNLILVSAGSATPHVQGVVRISQDGSHVYFIAQGVLTSAPNERQQTAQPGANNLYVFERDARFPEGRVAFIATLAPNDEELWGLRKDFDFQRPAQTTPDGRFLVFQSHADLTPDDTSSGVWQLFEYDAQEGTLVRVSRGQSGSYECPATGEFQEGFNCDGNTSADSATIPAPTFEAHRAGDVPTHVAVSNDGSYVFFQSADGLTPQALNDVAIDSFGDKANNVYEYHNGQVFLISDGQDVSVGGSGSSSAVELIGTSASGRDVFFTTGDQLVPQDGDTQQDVYDARSEGGFASPPTATACQGEVCRGALSAMPPIFTAASATQAGGDNLAPAAPTVAVKHRQVKHTRKHGRRRKHPGRAARRHAGRARGGQGS
jgi:hypothetical protein